MGFGKLWKLMMSFSRTWKVLESRRFSKWLWKSFGFLFGRILHNKAFSISSSSSLRLFINEGWPLSGHERVTEARLLLRLLV